MSGSGKLRAPLHPEVQVQRAHGSNVKIDTIPEIPGAYIAFPSIFKDNRGHFQETFNCEKYPRVMGSYSGLSSVPIMRQTNYSVSRANTIRGIHCTPYAKLVQCVAGEIFDIIVDLRPESPSYGKWYGTWLSPRRTQQLYIPARCGHAFFAKVDGSMLIYSQEDVYSDEESIRVNPFDKEISIDWPKPNFSSPPENHDKSTQSNNFSISKAYCLSEKDLTAQSMEAVSPRLQKLQARGTLCAQLYSKRKKSTQKHQHESHRCVDYVVIGYSGFLGSTTVRELRRQGYCVAM